MKTAIVTLESISWYQQGKFYEVPKLEKEQSKDYEDRTWRERCHYTPDEDVFIPPMAFKKSIETAARFLSIQIPGKGKATYTKHFKSGILVSEGLILPIKKADVIGTWVFVPSDGVPGGRKRVPKCFPTVYEWKGDVTFHILDEIITESIFRQHIEEAGNFIGIGVFRPERGGYYGRFRVVDLKWS